MGYVLWTPYRRNMKGAKKHKIGSVDDVQALIAKETGDSDYQVHVYGGE